MPAGTGYKTVTDGIISVKDINISGICLNLKTLIHGFLCLCLQQKYFI